MRQSIAKGVNGSRISVLHVITRLDMGGSAQNTLQSCIGLASKYDIGLIHGLSRESGMTAEEKQTVNRCSEEAERTGVTVTPLPSLVRRIHPLRDVAAFVSLVRRIAFLSPVIVHTHTSKAGVLGRVAAKVTGVPVVVHTPHGHVFYGHFGRFLSKAFLLIERMVDRFTDVTVALTQGEWDDYVRLGVTRARKMVKIHSGVDIERFAAAAPDVPALRSSLGIDADAAVIGAVGWLLPIKGPDILIRAMDSVWEKYPSAHLVFVGKGNMEPELRKMVRELGKTDQVHFLGWREEVWNIMPLFDIFALPSRNEGMGRVLVEAMAAGRPVVAARVGGIPDLVENEISGFLYPSEDSLALAEALSRLIADPELARRMGKVGRLKSRQFNISAMVDQLDRLYRRLISEKELMKTA